MTRKHSGIHFKKQPKETGLASIGRPHPTVSIYWRGRYIGYIDPPTWSTKDQLWRVRLRVTSNGKSDLAWKWGVAKTTFSNEKEARKWCKDTITEVIVEKKLVPDLAIGEERGT